MVTTQTTKGWGYLASSLLLFGSLASSAATSQCISLATSTVCPYYTSFAVNSTTFALLVPSETSPSTAKDIDTILNATSGVTYWSNQKSRLGCPSWTGNGVRFTVSYLCYLAVSQSAECNIATLTGEQTSLPPSLLPRPWCPDSCGKFADSVSAVMDNRTVCTDTGVETRQLRQNLVASFYNLCDALTISQVQNPSVACAPASPAERFCGFGNDLLDAQTFCRRQNDTCCASVPSFGRLQASPPLLSVLIGVVSLATMFSMVWF
ncbi:hypothetical protein BJ742DRAFT_887664 [Cladochytrium replicatum]|nr:hypothetical protein BJ742DRAFT_887664 [Cladochytrium replicatum]